MKIFAGPMRGFFQTYAIMSRLNYLALVQIALTYLTPTFNTNRELRHSTDEKLYLKAAKAASSRQRDEADVWRRGGRLRLINYQRPILEITTSLYLHLPEFLQSLDHINWKRKIVTLSDSSIQRQHCQTESEK